MQRVSPVFYAVAAGLVTLAIVPSTCWVLKNQADVAIGRMAEPTMSAAFCTARYANEIRSSSNERLEFGRIALQTGTYEYRSNTAHFEDKYGQLSEFTNHHPSNVTALATLGMWATATIPVRLGNPNWLPDATVVRNRLSASRAILNAATRGEVLEPNNALFPCLKAAALWGQDKKNEAASAFIVASRKPVFDGHEWECVLAETAAFEARYGYRGAEPRLEIAGSFLLPHLAHIKNMSKWMVATQGYEGCLAVGRMSELLMRSKTDMDILIARGLLRIAVQAPDAKRERSYDQLVKEADARDKVAGNKDHGLGLLIRRYRALLEWIPGEDVTSPWPFGLQYLPLKVGLVCLTCLILVWPIMLVFERWSAGRYRFAPYLALCAGFGLGTVGAQGGILGIALGIGSWLAKDLLRGILRVLGYVVAILIGTSIPSKDVIGWLIPTAYMFGDLFANVSLEAKWARMISICGATVVQCYSIWTMAYLLHFRPEGWIGVVLSTLVLTLAACPSLNEWPRLRREFAVVVAALAYLVFFGIAIYADRVSGEQLDLVPGTAHRLQQQFGLTGDRVLAIDTSADVRGAR